MSTAASFCHIVIPAPDLERAKIFYESVFDWRVEAGVPGPGYWFFESGNVGGAFNRDRHAVRGAVVLVLRVDRIEATLAAVVAHGGSVTRTRGSLGEAAAGFDAYFLDPNGNEIGLYESAARE